MGRKKQSLKELGAVAWNRVKLPGHTSPDELARAAQLAQQLSGASLKEPVLVIRGTQAGEFELVCGRVSLLAAARLGRGEIPCIMMEPDSMAEARVLQHLDGDRYNPWQLADTLLALKKRYGWTQAQLGTAIGKNRDFVANIMAVTSIQPEVRQFLVSRDEDSRLTTRHLRYVGRPAPEQQMETARRIVLEGLSTKKLEGEQRRPIDNRYISPFLHSADEPSAEGAAPRSATDWKRLNRRLSAELKRVEEREKKELEKIQRQINAARDKRLSVKAEARKKKMELNRELKRAMKYQN